MFDLIVPVINQGFWLTSPTDPATTSLVFADAMIGISPIKALISDVLPDPMLPTRKVSEPLTIVRLSMQSSNYSLPLLSALSFFVSNID